VGSAPGGLKRRGVGGQTSCLGGAPIVVSARRLVTESITPQSDPVPLTTFPGVQVDTTVTDPAGRTAVALELSAIAEGGRATTLYFDPTTHQHMAEGGPPGTFSSSGFTVYNEGVVIPTDAPPSGDQWLFPPA
jgi:hypothetical protein